jgi:hypothetical protein
MPIYDTRSPGERKVPQKWAPGQLVTADFVVSEGIHIHCHTFSMAHVPQSISDSLKTMAADVPYCFLAADADPWNLATIREYWYLKS